MKQKLMSPNTAGELHDHVHYERESCKSEPPCEPLVQLLSETYTIRPARYAKGKMAIHCKPDGTGWKTLAALVISEMKGSRYSNRESSYIVSPGCARKFEARLTQAQQQREERAERNKLFEEARSTGRAIGHIDGDPTNNVLSNLRVVTLQGDRR